MPSDSYSISNEIVGKEFGLNLKLPVAKWILSREKKKFK